MENLILEAWDYERKNRKAWLAKLEFSGRKITNREFYSPWEKDQKCYSGKLGKVRWRLNLLPDGIYELDQANENVMSSVRTYRTYLKIEQWQVVKEWSCLEELFEDILPTVPSDLPELIGSFKQVAWAEDIRQKAIQNGKISSEDAQKITDAKTWIDNRSKF